MSIPLLMVMIRYEHDVVGARQRARQIAEALGCDAIEQTRFATAVSEIARNAFVYAGGGKIEFGIEGAAVPQLLTVRVSDTGPGIARLSDILAGRYRSETGMGLGIVGARRLVDHFSVGSNENGTVVMLKKLLPRGSRCLSAEDVAQLTKSLASKRPSGPIEEVQQQNQELLRTLDDLNARQQELVRLNRELEDTNRGVVALYAELDERADHLRRADEVKTRFLSNMTHEFRTPVNSILALINLLADRLGVNGEQKDEIYYIRKSAQQLSDLVNDLLDLAKVEAGKIDVRPASFEVPALFGALRGMLRPLLVNQALALVFDEPESVPPIYSDESKVSQILRNFISNALKYTERGEVRVSVALAEDRQHVEFRVADTGLGIPEQDQARIFDEFVQIENPLQKRVKGTGLGLPLSKRLAELLHGRIAVESTLGAGSTFSLTIPLVYRSGAQVAEIPVPDPSRVPILLVEDADEDALLVERALAPTRYQPLRARTAAAAQSILVRLKPAAILLDIRLYGDDVWDFLAQLKRDPATADCPIVIGSTIDDERKGYALGADAYAVKPIDPGWLVSTLDRLVGGRRAPLRVLSIDDEEAARYIIRQLLHGTEHELIEAASGSEGLQKARRDIPDVVLLDLRLTDMTGFDVFDRLRADAATAAIPVLIITSKRLSEDDRKRLAPAAALVPKSSLTRDVLRTAVARAVSARRVVEKAS
jgi:signal transduction histidine kinase/CheY-like chemotaxis protein